jgi:ATP-dependent HslUV protease subunit HslV
MSPSTLSTVQTFRATTVLALRHKGKSVIAADGQVSMGETIIKRKARKVRKLYQDRILVGFAGASADAFNLFERLEGKLEQFNGNLTRAAVELAKDWRTDRVLRRLEALLIAMDRDSMFLIAGNGDVVEPDDELCAIGSGGPFALSAAKALVLHSTLGPVEIAREALKIAASICVYTNENIIVEEL